VIVEKGISPELREAILDCGMIPVERLSLRHQNSVQAATGCTMMTDLSSKVPAEHCGHPVATPYSLSNRVLSQVTAESIGMLAKVKVTLFSSCI
jgi:hypothetical protein